MRSQDSFGCTDRWDLDRVREERRVYETCVDVDKTTSDDNSRVKR